MIRNKKMSIITLALYFGLLSSFSAFAWEATHNTYGTPQCDNHIFYKADYARDLTGSPKILIENHMQRPMNILYEFRIYTEDGLKGTSFAKAHTIPVGGTYQHTRTLYQHVKYRDAGDYHYTVSIDISGDINEHTEKTCGVHVKKED